MNVHEVFANEFVVKYDEVHSRLLVYPRSAAGALPDVPISLSVEMLEGLGSDGASKWLGETILLLIPAARERIYKLPPEPN